MSYEINISPQLLNANLEYYCTNGIIMSVMFVCKFSYISSICIDTHSYSLTHKLATYSCTNTDYDQ